jgi:hypothetical protein
MERLHVILAGNYREALFHASRHHWRHYEWTYVSSAEKLQGLDDFELHRVGTWRNRLDLLHIQDVLATRRYYLRTRNDD